jgi:hypothetical protein
MSLLNIASDGLHNVLIAICNCLLDENGCLKEEELFRRIAPASAVVDDGKMARQTVNRWTELGLLVKDKERVLLCPTYFSKIRKIDKANALPAIRRAARACALSPLNNADLWAKEGARAADLTRSLCLLLAQDVHRTGFKDLEQLEIQQIKDPELRLVQNDTRLNGLQKWGFFLGFVRQPDGGDVDPTVAIRDWI